MESRNRCQIQIFLLSIFFFLHLPVSRSSNSQNLETFYPYSPGPAAGGVPSPSSGGNGKLVARVVAVTAAATLVLSAVVFLSVVKYSRSRRVRTRETRNVETPRTASGLLFRMGSRVKGVIVNENGCDVVYWKGQASPGEILTRKLSSLRRNPEPLQEIPLLEGNPSASHFQEHQEPAGLSSSDQSKSATFTSRAAPTPSPPPPPPPRGGMGKGKKKGEEQMKLKPLHWDTISTSTDHSMVWDKINDGSFKFDNGMMEALFGTVAANRTSPNQRGVAMNSQVTILDARKSQNIAIVMKSLPVSRKEVLDALRDGHGLDADVLEKLVQVAPSKEEQSQIVGFDGDPRKLPDAELFLYHLLRSVPSAFDRLGAMQFRGNYSAEVVRLREKMAVMDGACREVTARGLFGKLLEAVLKAGNKMNAGTSRGDAQAFKLTSLKKLADVKSTDGKTTLLYFVVEEVVRFEGKKMFSSKSRSGGGGEEQRELSIEEREREYKMLGLPVVGGISAQYPNVKIAATIEAETLSDTLRSLEASLLDNNFRLSRSVVGEGESGAFLKTMKTFFEAADEELEELKGEERRVREAVDRATEYYQSGGSNGSKSNRINLFAIVAEFLTMVDKTCVEISRNLQAMGEKRSSPHASSSRKALRFPNLPAHFQSEISSWSSD